MRELQTNEIAVVNGAGIVSSITGTIGSLVGSVVGSIAGLAGIKLEFAKSFKLFGQAIGSLITFDFKTALDEFKQGVTALFPPKTPETPAA